MWEQQRIEADRLQQQGIKQAQAGDLQAAIHLWQQALIIYRKIGERQGEGNTLGSLGLAHHFQGDYEQALSYHQQSLDLEEEMSARQAEKQSQNTTAVADYQFGEYISARQIGTRKSLAYAWFSLGFTYYWLNDYAKAIEQYKPSLEIARELGDHQNEMIVLAQLGEVYFYLGKYFQSIEHHKQAVEIAEETKDLSSRGNSLNSIGNAFSKLGEWTKAREYYQTALPILKEIGNPNGQGNALAGIGIAYSNQNDYKQAIGYFQQSWQLFQDIGNRYNSGRALNLLGQAYYFLGNYSQAIEYHQRSLAISQELRESFSEEKARSNLGLALYKSGNLKEAEENLRFSIDILESIRRKLGDNDDLKVSIFDRQAEPYQLLQAVLIAQDKKEKALEVAERGRARAFVELLSRRFELLESAQATINSPSSAQIQQIAIKQKATLVEYSLLQTRGLEEAKLYIWVVNPIGKIDFHSVDLEFFQPQKTSLSDLVIQVRQGLGIKEDNLRDATTSSGLELPLDIEYNPDPLRQLYRYLIQPISDFLPTDKDAPIIFIPQGDLFLVPFPSLQNPETKEFLIERHTILTAPSIQVLELTRRQQSYEEKQSSLNALVVGNPTMPLIGEPPEKLKSLPAAEVEAKAIASLLNTQAIIGEKATKVNIVQQLPQAKLIHLATHGLLDDIRKLGVPGAIALAPKGDDDGLLTAGEIMQMFGLPYNLPLVAELVVLSACVTGLGKITGDGVIGLSRCLMAAGVSSLVVSLWSVNDVSTTFLICKFYENLLTHKSVAKSLKEAQDWLRNVTKEKLKQYIEQLPLDKNQKRDFRVNVLRKIQADTKPFESPYYWAAFCAIGHQTAHI